MRDLGISSTPHWARQQFVASRFSSMTPAAAAAVRGSGSTFPALASLPQHMERMAMELENCCPVCLGSREEASYMMPCLHQFCYTCIPWWAGSKPKCSLCKRRVRSFLHLVREDGDFEEHIIPPPAAPSVVVHLTGGAPRHPAAQSLHHPAATWPAAARLLPWASSMPVPVPGHPSSMFTPLSSSRYCPGCIRSWGSSLRMPSSAEPHHIQPAILWPG